MRKNNLPKSRNLFRNKSFVRYVFVGLIYTFISPLIFIFLSQYFSRVISIIIFYPVGYFLKYFLYKNWVFYNKEVNLKKFLMHVTPIFFTALFFTHLTNFVYEVRFVAILLVIVNGFSGYLWGKLIYKSNIK